jgi:dTDP-4-amino-4,6-dideoxygalactose transaminase
VAPWLTLHPPESTSPPPTWAPRSGLLLVEAFDSNWIAPLGPQVDAFEAEFAEAVGVKHALALSSGTAALHLALIEAGVERGDEVLASDLTFVATLNPIRYLGATPVLIGSEWDSWNMDPNALEDALRDRKKEGRLPKAVVLVHLYGQPANLGPIREICVRYGVPLVEDAAEALGSRWTSEEGREVTPGTVGQSGIFSFNGNKIITTSGGGMLVSDDEALITHARKLSTQAREPVVQYEHRELGYNYRLSNLLAAVGRGQLRVLEVRVQARQRIFRRYREALGDLPGAELPARGPLGDAHPLAHLPHGAGRCVRHGPGGASGGAGPGRDRGAAPVEAHAPPAPLRGMRGVRAHGRGGALPDRTLPPLGVGHDGCGPGPGDRSGAGVCPVTDPE